MALFDNDLSSFQVRFVDVRICTPCEAEDRTPPLRSCQYKGCDLTGTCRVARHISRPGQSPEGSYDWFCARHAGEINKSYNFFDGLSEAEYGAFMSAERNGHKPSWKFGADTPFHGKQKKRPSPSHPENPQQMRPARRTRLQIKSFETLNLAPDSMPEMVRRRYAQLVKTCHPDSNGGDRSMEDQLARVIKAFKILKNARLA